MIYLWIAFGGALGAMARFGVGQFVVFPFGTLIVNVVGSFVIGVAYVYFTVRLGDRVPLMVMGGFLGAFTTFSAFSLDVLKLVDAERLAFALGYIFISVGLSILAVFAGVALAKGAWS
jgi:CrcB protein